MKRRDFLKKFAIGAGGLFFANSLGCTMQTLSAVRKRPNILLITADDMNWDAPNCFGGKVSEITPNINRLAAEGMCFEYAHITIAVCMPSRSVLMTGRYPHRNGAEGFEPIDINIPTLQEQLDKAGYINGILSKTGHLEPVEKFKWSMIKRFRELHNGRDPERYYKFAKQFMEQAKIKGQPFFLMANSDDPHRPFHNSPGETRYFKKGLENIPAPSRIYDENEVTVPGFLPDIPNVRKEVTQYYNSCRRCDDTVGAILKALKETGQDKNTLIMFLSDNGMAFPFSKTNCYLNSTRTPWIVKWPGKVKPNIIDKRHFISGIDFMPTILDVAGLPYPEGMDGKSFLPILTGSKQNGRDKVFTVFHTTAGKNDYPMRCIQNHRFGYIYNAWSDGKMVFMNESQTGLTMAAMKKAAKTNPEIAARVKLFLYRVPEELYDFSCDPDAKINLVNEPAYKKQLKQMRKDLLVWMEKTKDPLKSVFEIYLNTHKG
ncbi:MAG: sulfatase family protein [Planctomycetota bacterium]|jgi:N-sulfoglucosamine sulfohydrolase